MVGDCSSQFSFPYPNDPHERVYFIKAGPEIKGYVTATEVLLDSPVEGTPGVGAGAGSSAEAGGHGSKKGLYVITISGNKVKAGDAELILRGLEEKKAELGVDHILLPVERMIPSLINFPAIKGVYEHYSNGKPFIPIHHQDDDIRSAIETHHSDYNSGKYDHKLHNHSAVIFTPPRIKTKGPSISSKITPIEIKPIEVPDIKTTSSEEILDFLLDLNHSNRTDVFSKVISIPSVMERFKAEELASH